MEPSSYTVFPTKEDPSRIYKFTSIWLELGRYENIIERQTYSLLEWVGDVGGLYDGLRLICHVLMTPISTYALKSFLLAQIYRSTNKVQRKLKDLGQTHRYEVDFHK